MPTEPSLSPRCRSRSRAGFQFLASPLNRSARLLNMTDCIDDLGVAPLPRGKVAVGLIEHNTLQVRAATNLFNRAIAAPPD